MLIGHSRPANMSNALVGTGAVFDTDPRKLHNGRTASRTAIKFPTSGPDVKLQVTWPLPQPVRIIPLLNVSLPSGTALTFKGRRAGDPGGTFPYALGGNSTTQTITTLSDSSLGAYCITDAGLTDLIGYEITIPNLVPGAFFYLGESDPLQGWQAPFGIKREWDPDFEDLPEDVRSDLNQPWLSPEPTAGLLAITLGNVNYKTAYGDPADPTAIYYDKLANILAQGDACCAIPRWKNADGSLDSWSIHRTAIFGVARKVGRPQHTGGNRYEMSLTFASAPPNV